MLRFRLLVCGGALAPLISPLLPWIIRLLKKVLY
jgi:hypothetical protein